MGQGRPEIPWPQGRAGSTPSLGTIRFSSYESHNAFRVRTHRFLVSAKPWKGEGPGVFEIVEDHRGDTYRAAYTVRFTEAVYVLHCFQKKSPSGIRTAKPDRQRIHDRLKAAAEDYEVRYGGEKR
jgi:phage-related protein